MKGDHVHRFGPHAVSKAADGSVRCAGKVCEIPEGKPIPPRAEILRPLGGGCYESLGPVRELAGGAGPAQVSTPAYRDSYDRIFGVVGQA